mgnify:CR=1 FL=1
MGCTRTRFRHETNAPLDERWRAVLSGAPPLIPLDRRPLADRIHTREVNPMAKQTRKTGKDILEKRREKKAKQAASAPKQRKVAMRAAS